MSWFKHPPSLLLLRIFLWLTRHSMAVQIGSDGLLQLVVRGRLLEPQAQVVLQVLVELVTWKQQTRKNSSSKQACSSLRCLHAVIWPKVRSWKAVTFPLLKCCWILKEHKTGLVYLHPWADLGNRGPLVNKYISLGFCLHINIMQLKNAIILYVKTSFAK